LCSLQFSAPFPRSSNTGYERVDTEVVMLVQDTFGAVSLVLLHDAPCDSLSNTFCPITRTGYNNGCGRACDADGSLITFRTTMLRQCGFNGTACQQRIGSGSVWTTSSPRDLTPYTAGGEIAFSRTNYRGSTDGITCCPADGLTASNQIDWYRLCRACLCDQRSIGFVSRSGVYSSSLGLGSFASYNLQNGRSNDRYWTVSELASSLSLSLSLSLCLSLGVSLARSLSLSSSRLPLLLFSFSRLLMLVLVLRNAQLFGNGTVGNRVCFLLFVSCSPRSR
jgi:hypothetical protein